jgi:hypothetical protein
MVLIRPQVAMYAAFARLNYRPWFALAEFVDNALQSAIDNASRLRAADGAEYRLRVEIRASEDEIEIRDNAAGIHEKDYERAFRPASPPPKTSGLSEFGLGMKAAASWFAKHWTVRTSALGEPLERQLTFDIPSIVATNCEHLEPTEQPAAIDAHFTTLTLSSLNVRPKGRTLGKIRDHLESIYRVFLREGVLELRLNDEPIVYTEPRFLVAPHHARPDDEATTWRKDILLDLGEGHRVTGWAGILARASVANAGFAIFRRRRLIQGSAGEAYRPERIFGASNKFIYQRLVGELEVEGFSVSHTKDGVQWDDWEDDIITWLKDELDKDPVPLLEQADNYRARAKGNTTGAALAVRDVSAIVAQQLPPIVDAQLSSSPDESHLDVSLPENPAKVEDRRIQLRLEHSHRTWNVTLELISDPSQDGWYELSQSARDGDTVTVTVRVNLAHPFMVRFVSPTGDELVGFTRLAVALAIAEITAREVGVRQAGTVRRHLHDLLRTALSGPVTKGESGSGQ